MLVSPASYVIRKLGGLTRTATELNLAVSTVQGWEKRGRVPQKYWYPMIDVAKDRGEEISLADFLQDHSVEAAR
jgi:DNA-binding transcriptional regulator YiaG